MTTVTAALARSCPRCRGHLLQASDAYGAYASCVCCGFVQEWVSGPAIDLGDKDASCHRSREPKYRGRAV